MTVIRMPAPEQDPAELLTPDQWKIAEQAERGNRHCMRGMAEIYEALWYRSRLPEEGAEKPVRPERLFRLALSWRVKAAEAGDRDSMRWLSVYMIRFAEEFDMSPENCGGRTALEWQEAAARAGDKYCMKWMGDVCADPYRPEFDQSKAEDWYRRSARAGCVYAMDELGSRFARGIGCTADREEALRWYRAGAESVRDWRDLSGVEIRMGMEDLVKAAELMMQGSVTEEEREQLMGLLEVSLKLADRLAISPELCRSLSKVRIRLHNL